VDSVADKVLSIPQLNDLASTLYADARRRGFWQHPEGQTLTNTMAVWTAKTHSEVSEVWDAFRKQEDDHVPEEIADVLILTLELAAHLRIDVDKIIREKAAKNAERPYLHGRRV
jgi:NTP pyrophosphatase (non-canonical NTP hydrolase)